MKNHNNNNPDPDYHGWTGSNADAICKESHS